MVYLTGHDDVDVASLALLSFDQLVGAMEAAVAASTIDYGVAAESALGNDLTQLRLTRQFTPWQRLQAMAGFVNKITPYQGLVIRGRSAVKGAPPFALLREQADTVDMGSYHINTACLEDLIAMKKTTGRYKDAPKLAELLDLLRQEALE